MPRDNTMVKRNNCPIFQKGNVILLICILVLNQGCALIFGGSNYYAIVEVKNNPHATIKYAGVAQGRGAATIKVPRSNADRFLFTVEDDYCPEERFEFKSRAFRGWSFVGTVIFWTGVYAGIPLPWGVLFDGAFGAWWKPSIHEKGIEKMDYKHFRYKVNYENCAHSEDIYTQPYFEEPRSKADQLRELKELLDEGLINEDDYRRQKQRILDDD